MNILIADFDRKFVEELQRNWSIAGTNLLVCSDDKTLMPLIKKTSIDLAFIEVPFLMLDNMDLISYLKERQPGIEIFVLCDDRNWQGAASAITRGATSFLKKPVTLSLLENTASKIQAQQQNKSNTQLMESQVLDSLLGDTPEMRKILKTVYKVAPTNSTLLITGESGSGKEFLANVVHRYSKRANEPFVPVNCGAIPENLVESELFGHEKGAFTGALNRRIGRAEAADGGTLFLDEIGDLTMQTQVKLLRFLQERTFSRVGSNEELHSDVRFLAATSRNLEELIAQGKFREDLFYRLNIFPITMPDLAKRKSDIILLAEHFIEKMNLRYNKKVQRLSTTAINLLMSYHWPGNVRELENCIERAVLTATDDCVHSYNLPPSLQTSLTVGNVDVSGTKIAPLDVMMNNYEREIITEAIKRNNGNLSAAGRDLGVSPRMMNYRMNKLGIKSNH